jgi:hypothetical protein
MSLRNRLFLSLALPALAFLVGCGGSSNHPVPPPTGGFSNSNLKGTYVFTANGFDALNNGVTSGNFLIMAGTLNADGSGGIASGNLEINSTETGLISVPITGGSYSISSDGRGIASLTANTGLPNKTRLDFVLTSNNHGLVTEFDGNGGGSGTLDLQTSTSQPAAGTYVFNLTGTGALGAPLATVGAVALDASGNATGNQDLNNNGTYTALSIGSGSSVLAGSPGSATLGSFSFDVYSIDATHLKFIETDSQGFLAGDLFSQTSTTFPSGAIAFTMSGLDGSLGFPMALGGLMNSDGASLITSGIEDFNDGGNIDVSGSNLTPQSFSGSFASSNGRFLLTLNNFFNGQGGVTGTFIFAAYPSSGGLQLLEIDGGGITGGVAFAQTSTSFESGQGYGLNLAGSNQSSEEDDIAEFTNTNNTLKGLVDINDQGTTSSSNFNATYSPDSTNPGHGLITGFFTLATYAVDSNTTIFIEIDSGQVGMGSIGLQDASSEAAMASRLASIRPRMAAHAKGWKHVQFQLRKGK